MEPKENLSKRIIHALFFAVMTVKGGPALLDFLAAAFRAHDAALLIVDERYDLREQFLAVRAEEFVLRHLPQVKRG